MQYLPLTFTNGSVSVEAIALLDTGASVNEKQRKELTASRSGCN